MTDAISMVLAVQTERGALKKQSLLAEFKANTDFCRLLYYALNPLLTYKISEQTLRKTVPYRPEITLTLCDIFEVCEMLSHRKALDDITVYQVCSFVQLCPPDEREFYTKLLSKTLRLGITAKTVNKIIPGLIPEWKVQQAYPIEKYPLKDGTWFALTQKLNGVRATYYKGKLYARSGVPFEGLDHIIQEFSWDNGYDFVFDGELTLRDKGTLSDNEAFRMATGIVNSDGDKTCICYTIFDLIPTSEFEKGESEAAYRMRRNALDTVKATLSKDGAVSVLPVLYSGTDQDRIAELLEQMVQEDKEGLMVNLDVPYKCKRHNGILKVKRFYTMDLPILRCESGTGKLTDTLGAIVVDYDGAEVGVGSGFTDEERAWIWAHKDEIVGTLAEVKYKETSFDKSTGNRSLQFPVFVSLRTDKQDVSFG